MMADVESEEICDGVRLEIIDVMFSSASHEAGAQKKMERPYAAASLSREWQSHFNDLPGATTTKATPLHCAIKAFLDEDL